MAKFNYAVELSDNTVIYKIGYGIILNEPSVIAVKNANKKPVIECVGNDAIKFLEKPLSNVEVIQPIKDGVVVNKTYATLMLKEFIKKIKNPFEAMNCVFLFSVGLSQFEKNELINVLYSANFKEVLSVPSAMAGLIQMDADVTSCYSSMLVSISNITEISVVNNGELLEACSIDIGSNVLDIAIKEYVNDKYNGVISLIEAKRIRQEISTLLANDVSRYSLVADDVDGFGTIDITIESQEIRGILVELFNKICGTIQAVLGLCTATVAEEIKRKGIYLCGELCGITGIERFVKSKLNIPVYADLQYNKTIILGGGVILNNPQLLKELSVKK